MKNTQEKKNPAMQVQTQETTEQAYGQSAYRERARKLLIKGGIGFAIGLIIAILGGEGDFGIGGTVFMALFFAGIPYGWEVMGKMFGHWLVVGSLPIMIVAYFLQFIGALIIGWIAYPIALLFNLMKSQEKGSTAQKVYLVALAALVILLTAFIILMISVSRR